jgi:hypothetical protein
MTRRDRAAMQLALELVRKPHTLYGRDGAWYALDEAMDALRLGSVRVQPWCLRPYIDRSWDFETDEIRLVRARLYLALRVLLRADGDGMRAPRLGRWLCPDCGRRSYFRLCQPCGLLDSEEDYSDTRRRFEGMTRCITPLWEKAPAHAP